MRKCLAFLLLGTALLFSAEEPPIIPPTPSPEATKETLRAQIPLWPAGKIPSGILRPSRKEIINHKGSIAAVSTPSLVPLSDPPLRNFKGIALIVFPGGGYNHLDWTNHVIALTRQFHPRGIRVFALKYRTKTHAEDPADAALMDAQRAVRLLRSQAKALGIRSIGVVAYSAGANLAMRLAENFDYGKESAEDPIERYASRPDFIVSLSTWHYRRKESPFTFREDTPPIFLGHATDDKSAPVELAINIRNQLQRLAVPVHLELHDNGGHGAFHFMPKRSGAHWPDSCIHWLSREGILSAKQSPAMRH